MTAATPPPKTSPPKTPTFKLLPLLICLILLAAGGGVSLFASRYEDGAERVVDELPDEMTVRDGVIYYAQTPNSGGDFTDGPPPTPQVSFYRAEPGVFGATARLLGTVTLKGLAYSLMQPNQTLNLQKDAILLVEERRGKASPPLFLGGGGFAGGAIALGGAVVASAPRDLGDFAAPAAPVTPKPGETRDTDKFQFLSRPPRSEYVLWRIPLRGGVPVSTPLSAETDAGGLIFPPGADAVYWLNDPHGSLTSVSAKTAYWRERSRSAALKTAPLTGGSPRTLASGIAAMEGLFASDQTVAYLALQPLPDPNPVLHVRRVLPGSDTAEILLPDFHGRAAPVECANRWFWIEAEPPQSPDAGESVAGGPTERSQIVTAQSGGGGRRVLVPARNEIGEGRRCDRLFVHHDRLYLLYTAKDPNYRPTPSPDGPLPSLRSFLVRLDPERGVVGKPLLLPNVRWLQCICDGDYFYFAGTRDIITWRGRADILFAERGASVRQRRSLYRVPLPKQ